MVLQGMLGWGENTLQHAGIEEYKIDAWRLLEAAMDIDRNYFYLHLKDEVDVKYEDKFRGYIEKRIERVPLQYITGIQEFMGLDFEVDENVLIPRQDTEILVEEVLKNINSEVSVLDMCTGSGCIIISLAKFSDYIRLAIGADISIGALKVANRNVFNNKVNVVLIESDLFDKITEKFDIIVSNPPYIRTEEINVLMPEVKQFEPFQALDGKQDGLFFYRKIVDRTTEFLNIGGELFFEIGYDQGQDVYKIMKSKGFSNIKIVKDLAGLDRVIWGRYR